MKKLFLIICLIFAFLLVSCDSSSQDSENNENDTEKIKVTFDLNDGSGNVLRQKVNQGENLQKPSDPKREGYTFCGWLSGRQYWDFENGKVTREIMLVAHWLNDDDFSFVDDGETCIIEKYTGNDSVVIIPPYYKGMKVRSIATTAFKNNETLRELVLPDTMVSIGGSAFENCEKLRTINLPES
ncbi:MAG: InlB B-repeat-containing protein, partial [Clostridia bacterium]|nr:InlB B-repeat-containing protein [Clostridia bacterium]